MKVPDKIKKAIKECAESNAKANYNEKIVHKWLETMKLTEETASNAMRNMDDSFIDYCTMTNNPDEFIEVLENLQ